MAAGQLSGDQSAFVQQVSAGTGLAPAVVTSWVGAESGWGVTKPDHNYLNVGPGEAYNSVSQSASRVSALINGSPNYAGIRSAIPAGGAAQVSAISASPWGTSGATLASVYSDVSGQNVSLGSDIAGAVGGAVASAVPWESILSSAGKMALGLVFVVAAVALIGVGLSALTGTGPREAASNVGSVVDHIGAASKIAAMA